MRYSIDDAQPATEVELGEGHVFVVQELTKHLEAKLAPLEPELNEKLNDARKGADLVAVIGQYFDIVLKRLGDTNGAKQSRPSTLLKRAWEANSLSIERLVSMYRVVDRSGFDDVPPT